VIPQISITLTPQALALLASARSWPRALTANLQKTLNFENELTVGHIVEKRATGRGPFPPEEGRLGVVTSRYRRAVRRAGAIIANGEIWSAIGNNVRYAGGHEFGFTGTVQVKEHQRRRFGTFIVGGGAYLDPNTGRIKKQRKREIEAPTGISTVRAHPRDVAIPERAPIRRGIADRALNYREALSTAIVNTFTPAA
jgi:hypothetical protein